MPTYSSSVRPTHTSRRCWRGEQALDGLVSPQSPPPSPLHQRRHRRSVSAAIAAPSAPPSLLHQRRFPLRVTRRIGLGQPRWMSHSAPPNTITLVVALDRKDDSSSLPLRSTGCWRLCQEGSVPNKTHRV